jgi:hypothetical protein
MFMSGETEVMVPLTIVPASRLARMLVAIYRIVVKPGGGLRNRVAARWQRKDNLHTVLELDRDSLVLALHQKPTRNR